MKNNKEIFFDSCFVVSFIIAFLSLVFFALICYTKISFAIEYYNKIYTYSTVIIGLFSTIKIIVFVVTIILNVLSTFLKNRIVFLINAAFDLASSIIFIKGISNCFAYKVEFTVGTISILVCMLILIFSFLLHLVFALTYEKKYQSNNNEKEEINNDSFY